MKLVAMLQSVNEHFSNPNGVVVQFGSDDGTAATLVISKAAREGLHVGTVYELEIKGVVADEKQTAHA